MKNLVKNLKECKVLVVNGETYFGKASSEDGGSKIIITEVVEVTEKGNFKKVIKDWIKAKNLGELEESMIEGVLTLATKPLTKQQEMQIDSIAAEALYRMANAIPNLQNASIDEI